jgi:hypothetical protein
MTRSCASTISNVSSGGFIKSTPFGRIELFGSEVEVYREKSSQFFSSLGKALFDKSVEGLEVGQGCWATREAKNGRVHLGARIKNFGRKIANLFDIKNRLEQDRNSSVFGCAGECRVTIGNLLLQSDHNHLGGRRAESELDEERGRNGVGKISADVGSGGVLRKCFEGISLNQLKAGFVSKLFTKPRDKTVIDFECFDRVSNGE